MWCLAARDSGLGSRTSRTANTLSRGHGVKGHTRSGADDGSRTRGLDHGVVALCLLSYIRKVQDEASASTGVVSRQVVKERPPSPVVRSIDRGPAPMRRPVEQAMKKARILSESGPLRTERGRCAARRFLLPETTDPRSDQGNRSSDRHGRTRPGPAGAGGFE